MQPTTLGFNQEALRRFYLGYNLIDQMIRRAEEMARDGNLTTTESLKCLLFVLSGIEEHFKKFLELQTKAYAEG